jgi:hypothetical protein
LRRDDNADARRARPREDTKDLRGADRRELIDCHQSSRARLEEHFIEPAAMTSD